MKIYRFTPIDLDHHDWVASYYKGVATVCAPNKNAAIDLLMSKSRTAVKKKFVASEISLPPWYLADVVEIEEIEPRKVETTELQILEPKWLDREFP